MTELNPTMQELGGASVWRLAAVAKRLYTFPRISQIGPSISDAAVPIHTNVLILDD